MKSISRIFMSMLAVAALLLTYGCGDDTETADAPTIVIDGALLDVSNSYSGVPGDQLIVNVRANSALGMNRLSISKAVDGGAGTIVADTSRAAGQTTGNLNLNFSYTLVQAEVGTTITFTATAVDDDGAQTTGTFTVITDNPPNPTVMVDSTFLIAAPLGNNDSKTFYSSSEATLYSYSDVQNTTAPISPTIDFGYFYGVNEFGATLAGIDNYPRPNDVDLYDFSNWTRNQTAFRTTTLTAAGFDALTEFDDAAIAAEFENGTDVANTGQARNLEAGQVIAFRTDADKDGGAKFGLIKVVEVVLGTSMGTGSDAGLRIMIKVNM